MKKVAIVCVLLMMTWLVISLTWETILTYTPTVLISSSLAVTTQGNNDKQSLDEMSRDYDQAALKTVEVEHPQGSMAESSTDHLSYIRISKSLFPVNDSSSTAIQGNRKQKVNELRPFSNFVHRWNLTKERKMPEIFKKEPVSAPDLDDPSLKKILLWNDFYTKFHYSFGLGREPFLKAGCPYTNCMTTSNRSLFPMQEIDALVWHFRSEDRQLPPQRFSHTRYVFLMQESPMNLFGDLKLYDGVFNWTFTYRLDSDFPSPAGFVTERTTKAEPLPSNMTETKTKIAAWFVSNCKSSSGRESLVRSLEQHHVPVDIFGACGPFTCKRSQQSQCYQMLEDNYKFYLSLENSLCRDYITEKFFHILQYNVVPVVWGLGDYTSQAPPHSFINAAEFDSIEELASYLKYLDRNTSAYMEYFKWKMDYEVITGYAASVKPWCDLCKHLNEDHDTKSINNLHDWFNADNDCKYSTSTKIARFVHGEKEGDVFSPIRH